MVRLYKKVFLKKTNLQWIIESIGMKYVDVVEDMTDRWSGKKTPTKVLLVKKFNKLIESDTVSMIYRPDYSWGNIDENKKYP